MIPAALTLEADLTRYRSALIAFCYRLTGSFHEAEDLAQETLLRAWKNRDSLAQDGLLRPWLYRIATNAYLDTVKSSRRRELPQLMRGPSSGAVPMEAPAVDTPWIEPAPDSIFQDEVYGPEARYTQAQSVSLAFVATLSRLNARQRAVVLLRDVLGWSAKETAETLEMSDAAVNSTLLRARAALENLGASEDPKPQGTHDVLRRYLRAWQERNLTELVALLRSDAVLAMPPIPSWYKGPADVCAALEGSVFGPAYGELTLRELHGNGCWGMAGWYRPEGASTFLPLGVQLVRLHEGRVSEIVCFLGEAPLKAFGFGTTPPPL